MSSRIAWNYAAQTYLSISKGEASIPELPRIMCATLLFLRASHEAYAEEKLGGDRSKIGKPGHDDMVAFVRYAKNAIIHGPERISMIAGEPVTPPEGVRLAFRIKGFEIDFDGPDSYEAKPAEKAAAKRYATRRDSRGVVGGLLAEVWDAVRDTGDMIDVPPAELERFEKSGVPFIR